jgi:hypothetical protein
VAIIMAISRGFAEAPGPDKELVAAGIFQEL